MGKTNTANKETKKQEKNKESEDKSQVSQAKAKPRIVSNPNDVASLVLMQIDAVSAKKDDLTIAIKGLGDLTKQLVRAYAENMKAIQGLQTRIKELEGRAEESTK